MPIKLQEYINIHSHSICKKNTTGIINLFAHQFSKELMIEGQYYSIGLHPLHINGKTFSTFEKTISDNINNPQIIALGESGLDRRYSTDIQLQMTVLEKHSLISERNEMPVIIHCVRSYNDLISVRNSANARMPWILHAYYGNIQTTAQLLKHNIYFSFGKNLIHPTDKLIEVINLIPLDRVFFENDEDDLEIETAYDNYSRITGTDISLLKNIIRNNFKECFGIQNVED